MIIIEEISDKTMTKEQARYILLRREDFGIKILGTLEPHEFNEKLDFPSQAYMQRKKHPNGNHPANPSQRY